MWILGLKVWHYLSIDVSKIRTHSSVTFQTVNAAEC